jgi:hypothetical protein|tara:strand:- start:1559 stop:1873 length:315 start_codon:yes stop_codon:yes gene_type:complete
MELDKDKRESWIFAVWEGLYEFTERVKYTNRQSEMVKEREVRTAMEWIEKALFPIKFISEEKLAVMQKKGLIQELYLLTNSGSKQLSPEECEQVADMILRRKKA